MNKLINISELSKIINLIDPKSKKPLNYILRYWEKEFKEIKPKKINNRRYYSPDQVQIIKMIKYLLKNKGMTINGVKKYLSTSDSDLDEYNNKTINKTIIKTKLNRISSILKNIKSNG